MKTFTFFQLLPKHTVQFSTSRKKPGKKDKKEKEVKEPEKPGQESARKNRENFTRFLSNHTSLTCLKIEK